MTKYSLDSWDGRRFLSGHVSYDDEKTWQRHDPLIIVALMIAASQGMHAERTEIELLTNSIELTVWWKDE